MSKGHIDTAVGGAFLSLTIDGAMTLIKKNVTNQSWGGKKIPNRYAYHKRSRYAFYENGSFDEKVGRTCHGTVQIIRAQVQKQSSK
jgi:hypothetical protein